MSPRLLGSFLVCGFVAAVFFFSAPSAGAVDTMYWLGSGGTGTWDLVLNNWTLTPGGTPNTTWVNGNDAVFGGDTTGYNVTVDSAGVSVHNMTISNGGATGYDFLAGGGTITFVGSTPTLTLPTGMTTNIRVPIGGTAGLIIDSPGPTGAGANLWLEAASTVSGVKEIKGTVQVTLGNNSAFGAYAGGAADQVIVDEGAQVVTWASRTINNDLVLYGSGSGTGGVLRIGGGTQTFTLNGAITLGSSATLKGDGGTHYAINNSIDGSAANANFTMTLDGGSGNAASVITGNVTLGGGMLTKGSDAPLTLLGTGNSWTGGTTINNGTLQIGDGGANGSLPDAGFISFTSGTAVLLLNSSNNFTLNTAPLSGSGALTHNGSGTVTLGADNSAFSGPINIGGYNLGAGALRATAVTALGSGTVNIGGGTSTSRLELANTGIIYNPVTLNGRVSPTSAQILNANGSNTLAGDLIFATGGSQYVIQSDATDAGTLTIQGNINDSLDSARYLVIQGGKNGDIQGSINNTGAGTLGLVKAGAGTWTLSSSGNAYYGNTTINGGKLALGASGAIPYTPVITVNSPGSLDVSAVSGGFKLNTNQALAGSGTVIGSVGDTISGAASIIPGGAGATATLTFNNNLALTSGFGDSLKFDLRQTPTDPLGTDIIKVLGNFNSTNPNKIDLNFSLLQPTINNLTFPLIQYGSYTGSVADFTISGLGVGRQTFTIVNNTLLKEIELQVSGGTPMSLTWAGGLAGNAWDINTTKNWTGSGPQYYFDGDLVTFNDAGSNSPPVNITTKVTPGTLTFNNSTKDYVLGSTGGAGYISGSTGLTKNGTGKVTLATVLPNDFTGAIVINAGTLQIGDGLNGSGISTTPAITNNGAFIINRPNDMTLSNPFSGAGSLTKNGAGVLTVPNANSAFTGPTTISGGKLVMGNVNALGPMTTGLPITINGTGTLQFSNDFGTNIFGNRVFTVAGPGYDGNGAIINVGSSDRSDSVIRYINLTGDTTIGGSMRWDLRNPYGSGYIGANIAGNNAAYLKGNNFNLTKMGTNIIALVDVGETNLANINITQGTLAFQGSTTMGDPNKTVTVAAGAMLGSWGGLTVPTVWTKNIVLQGGSIGNPSGWTNSGTSIFDGPVTLVGGGTLSVTSGSTNLIRGAIGGSGGLTKNDAGNATLSSNSNNWTGGTIINAGTLQIGDGGANGSFPDLAGESIAITGTLYFNSAGNFTLANAAISGAGAITHVGSGILTLSGNNPSFTGTVNAGNGNLSTGAVRITNANAVLGTTNITVSGGYAADRLELSGNQTFAVTNTFTLGGRQPFASVASQLVNASDSNSIPGTVALTTGGNQYLIEAAAGTLTLAAITNNTGNTANRYLYLKGAGNGQVTGVIGSGTGTGLMALSKSGGGTWTLSGANTYAGNTTINGGTLAIGAGGSIAASPLIDVRSGTLDVSAAGGMNLAAGQTLGGSGTVNGSIASSSGSSLAPGSAFNVGTLTMNNNLTLAGSGGDAIDYNVNGAAGDSLAVAGTLTLPTSGVTTINFIPTGVPTAATYTVASAGTLVGAAGNLALNNPTRYAVTGPNVVGNTITLGVTGSNASLVWNSASSAANAWDVKTSNPWLNGAAADTYAQADNVTFNDTAAYTSVNVATTVSPLSITVGGAKSYTFSGAGRISGSTGFAMNGAGTTTLATVNDYSGATSVTSGTLFISGSVGPNSPVMVTGGTLRLGSTAALGDNGLSVTATTTVNGGTLDFNGQATPFERIYVQGSGAGGVGALINTGGALNNTGPQFVVFTGDTTFGGTSRWDIGGGNNATTPYTLQGNGYKLTRVGSNESWLINLGNIGVGEMEIVSGTIGIQGTTAPGLTGINPVTGNPYTILVRSGATLGFYALASNNIITKNIVLEAGATMSSGGGNNYVSSPITLSGTGAVNFAVSASTFFLGGSIGGTAGLTKSSGNTTMILTGATANTYTGDTNVFNGTVALWKTPGVNAIAGNINIGNASGGADTLRLQASNQIADTSVLTFNGSSGNTALFELRGFDETVGGISDSTGYGIIQLQDASSIDVDSNFTVKNTGANSYNGYIRDKSSGTGLGKLNFVKDGPGTQLLTGSNITYTGNTTVSAGILDMPNLNTPSANVSVAGGAKLIATSIRSNTLSVAPGGIVEIRPIPGGPLAGAGEMSAVPEPSTWIMLLLALIGLAIYRRSRR